MSKNRVIYNSLGIFASQNDSVLINQSGPNDLKQLKRIQSFNYDINRNFEDLNILGSLSTIKIEKESPNITLNLSYYLSDGWNEDYIGLNADGGPASRFVPILSGIISNNSQKNYYCLISEEGVDLNTENYNDKIDIIGFGNTHLKSYKLNASVGSIPKVDVELDALNLKFYKNPSKIWNVLDTVSTFTNDLNQGRVKIVNNSNTNDLIIVSEPLGTFFSPLSGPDLFVGNNSGDWSFISTLTGVSTFTDNLNSARYGASIAASDSGKYIVIGGPNSDEYTGSALLYARSGNSNNWNLIKKISGVSNNPGGPIYAPYGPRYGTNVSISKSGDILMMNGPYDEFSRGGALIYTGTNWDTPAYKLSGSQYYTMGLGADMNEDGSVIILGGGGPFYFDGVTDIFTGNKNIGWKLAQSITGENYGQYGATCTINDKGDVIILGGPYDNSSVLIYTGNATNQWSFAQKLTGMNNNSYQKLSINSDGSTIVVGNDYDYSSYIGNGMISIYIGNPQSKWSLDQIISGENDGDYFGHDVAVNYNGNLIASLAPGQIEVLGYNGVVNLLSKIFIKGLPSVDADEVVNTENLSFRHPLLKSPIDTEISAMAPGDIIYQITGAFGFDNIDLKVQDFSLSIDLNRTPLKKVGKQYPFTKEIDYPIKAQLDVTCLVGDLNSNNLTDLICNQSDYNFSIIFNSSRCFNYEGNIVESLVFRIRKAKLISQNFESDIANNSTMNATYEIDLSSAADTEKGLCLKQLLVKTPATYI